MAEAVQRETDYHATLNPAQREAACYGERRDGPDSPPGRYSSLPVPAPARQ